MYTIAAEEVKFWPGLPRLMTASLPWTTATNNLVLRPVVFSRSYHLEDIEEQDHRKLKILTVE